VISVVATGLKGRGLKPGRVDGLFNGNKIPQNTFPREQKQKTHVVLFYGMLRTLRSVIQMLTLSKFKDISRHFL
jgi:hypothetical protein